MKRLVAVLLLGTPSFCFGELPSQYNLFNLGPVGRSISDSWDINDSGEVVGSVEIPAEPNAPSDLYPFIWDSTNGMRRLSLPSPNALADGFDAREISFIRGNARKISNTGKVMGNVFYRNDIDNSSISRCILWENTSDSATVLSTEGLKNSVGMGINGLDQVILFSWTTITNPEFIMLRKDYVIQDGVTTLLTSLIDVEDFTSNTVFDINDLGEISGIGTFNDLGSDTYIYLWNPSSGLINTNIKSRRSVVINDISQVSGGNEDYFYVWDSENGIRKIEDDSFAGSVTINDINNLGQVIGGLGRFGSASDAFIWDPDDGVRVLTSFIPSGSSFISLDRTSGINGNGQIVGTGTLNTGEKRAFLLSPVASGRSVSLTVAVSPITIPFTNITPTVGIHIFNFPGIQIFLNAEDYNPCPQMFVFSNWTGDVSNVNSSSTTIILDVNKVVTANFIETTRVCGDLCHPHVEGDLNRDCRVDLSDFSIWSRNWASCTHPDCDLE
jgi:probable HAF family extracellular repeat protein